MTILLLLIQLSFFNPGIPTDMDSSDDKVMVEDAVVAWANQIFINHSSYKFDYFKAFYTDEYFIQTMRLELYSEKIADLKEKKANGTYNGSQEKYDTDINKLSGALETANTSIDTMDRVTHYQTHFWTNIQTKDGITVYYELDIKLNNNYQVVEALENSSIGKKNGDSKIAYKSDSTHVMVIEK